jgi:hypothetical protein
MPIVYLGDPTSVDYSWAGESDNYASKSAPDGRRGHWTVFSMLFEDPSKPGGRTQRMFALIRRNTAQERANLDPHAEVLTVHITTGVWSWPAVKWR